MEKEENKELAEKQEKDKKKPEEKLPFCTTPASPEHARGDDLEEPCDDFTSGDGS
jgi:hypothetical protein